MSSTSSPISRQISFSTDRPIETREADKLDRATFAEELARAIGSWKGTDSLVIGLYGPWGTGKTSIKNIVLDVLARNQGTSRPDVLEFNPWSFAGQDQLGAALFSEIGKKIGVHNNVDRDKKLAADWKRYASALEVAGSFGEVVPKLAEKSLPIVLFLVSLGFISQTSVIGLVKQTGPILTVLGCIVGAIAFLAPTLMKMSKYFLARSKANEKSVYELKTELSKQLEKRPRSLLIVMDDIDRLQPAEIRLLFQLVKVNCDLPRLVFLLLFQRDIIERSLTNSDGAISGPEYLEKIIQVGFDVPKVDRTRLEGLLFDGLNRLIAPAPIDKYFQKRGQVRWANLFVPGLRPYFETLRDVYRFLSTFEFHLGILVRGERRESLEVNPMDLVALEVLRLYEPRVFHEISEMKDVLTSTRDTGHSQESQKKAVLALVEKASKNKREAVVEIVKQLFPNIEWAFGGSHYADGFQEEWSRELRVCSQAAFDRYFCLAIPQGEVGQYEIDRIIKSAKDRKVLVDELRSLNGRGLLGVALERLEDWKGEIDLSCAEPLVTGLFDIGDELPDKKPGFFVIEPGMHAVRVIYHYLRREPRLERREEVLERSIVGTTGIYLPAKCVSLESNRRKEKGERDHDWLFAEEKISHFQGLCVQKISQASLDGAFIRNPNLAYVLFCWNDWAGNGAVQKWAAEMIKSEEGALSLLRAFAQPITSQGLNDYAGKVRWVLHLGNLEKFVGHESVETALQNVNMETLAEADQRALGCFQRAVERRRQGKPDDWSSIRDAGEE